MRQRFLPPLPAMLLAGGVALGNGAAQAAPNGLTQIPIAKVFGDGVAAFSMARAVQSSQTTTYTTQYGLLNRFEVGVDYQAAPPNQTTLLGNAKYLVAHHPRRLPDIACGLTNVATGQKAAPYLVATTQPRATGLSLGLIRPSGGDAYYGMGGVSYNVSPTFQFVADVIGGKANYGTVGVIDSLTRTLSLNVAYARPNTAGDAAGGGLNPRGYIVNLSYVFHLKGGGRAQAGTSNKNPAAGAGGGGGGK